MLRVVHRARFNCVLPAQTKAIMACPYAACSDPFLKHTHARTHAHLSRKQATDERGIQDITALPVPNRCVCECVCPGRMGWWSESLPAEVICAHVQASSRTHAYAHTQLPTTPTPIPIPPHHPPPTPPSFSPTHYTQSKTGPNLIL